MKKTITLLSFILLILCHAVTASAQGYLEVYLKSGISQRFYLDDFKELRSSRRDTIGALYSNYVAQEVVMADSTYRFMMNEVDSIRFKKVTDEDIREDWRMVVNNITPLLNNATSLTEAANHIEEIKSFKGVQDAYVSGMSLFIVMENMCKLCYYYPPESNMDQTALAKSKKQTFDTNAITSLPPKKASILRLDKKALVYNQLYRDLTKGHDANAACPALEERFRGCGVHVKSVTYGGTLKFFEETDFSEYDYIYLCTHGCLDKDGKHYIATSEEVPEDILGNEERLRSLRSNGIVVKKLRETREENGPKILIPYYCISEDYISEGHKSSKRKSIMVNGACESLKGHAGLFEAFEKRGIGMYIGYDNSNSVFDEIGLAYFSNMLNGMSAEMALDNLNDRFKHNSGTSIDGERFNANLRVRYSQNSEKDLRKEFISPVILDNYKGEAENVILATGVTRAFAISNELKFGFRYSNNEDMVSYKSVECQKPKMEDKALAFEVSIPLQKPDTYLQPYTYDGKNYNFGKVEKLPMPNITKVEMKDSQYNEWGYYPSSSDITDGSEKRWTFGFTVEYSASFSKKWGSEWGICIINGNGKRKHIANWRLSNSYTDTFHCISSEPVMEIRVCAYVYSGGKYLYSEEIPYTLEFVLSSCPDENHPHKIDMDLKSGTHWYCCNAGAKTPTDRGDFYEIGRAHV